MFCKAALTVVALSATSSAAALDAAAELHQLGRDVLAKLDQIAPVDALHGAAQDDELPALGPCVRPTAREKEQLKRLVTHGIAGEDYTVRFGCKDAAGVIVSAAYDLVDHGHHIGAWDVLRVAGGKATPIARYRGTSVQDYMEWADETSVSVRALVDLDGDGIHDALLATSHHEGGSRHSNEDLS